MNKEAFEDARAAAATVHRAYSEIALAIVHRLVRRHRLAGDIADGEDVRHAGAHLAVDGDEAACVGRDARRFQRERRAVGPPARRLEDEVVCALDRRHAGDGDGDAVWSRDGLFDARAEEDVTEPARVLLAPDRHRVAVDADEQAVEPLDHVNCRTQGAVDRRHFEADDAAADHQHALRHEGQLQRAGGIDDARIVRQEGQAHRRRAGGDDALPEADRAAAAIGRDDEAVR